MQDWLEEKGETPIKINVDVSEVESEIGMGSVTVEFLGCLGAWVSIQLPYGLFQLEESFVALRLPLTETCAAVKAKLVAMGVRSIPANRMKLHCDPVGYLKERFTFAFYNLTDGVTLSLSQRKRGGSKFRRDHTVLPKRPKAPPPEKKPEPAADAAKAGAPDPAKLAAMGGLTAPKMGAPGAPAPTMPGGMPGGMPGMPGGMPGGMPAMPGGMPMPPMGGGMPPGAPMMAGGCPKMGMPGAMPMQPMGMPGMGMPGMMPKAGMPGAMPTM